MEAKKQSLVHLDVSLHFEVLDTILKYDGELIEDELYSLFSKKITKNIFLSLIDYLLSTQQILKDSSGKIGIFSFPKIQENEAKYYKTYKELI